jgi:peroxiredoxin
VFQDPECKIAGLYRIAFIVPQQFRAAYLMLGYPNSETTGSEGWALPIPATYVLDSTGLVVLSYPDADRSTRLDPPRLLLR